MIKTNDLNKLKKTELIELVNRYYTSNEILSSELKESNENRDIYYNELSKHIRYNKYITYNSMVSSIFLLLSIIYIILL